MATFAKLMRKGNHGHYEYEQIFSKFYPMCCYFSLFCCLLISSHRFRWSSRIVFTFCRLSYYIVTCSLHFIINISNYKIKSCGRKIKYFLSDSKYFRHRALTSFHTNVFMVWSFIIITSISFTDTFDTLHYFDIFFNFYIILLIECQRMDGRWFDASFCEFSQIKSRWWRWENIRILHQWQSDTVEISQTRGAHFGQRSKLHKRLDISVFSTGR